MPDACQVEYFHAHRDQVRKRPLRLRVDCQQTVIESFGVVEAPQELESDGLAEQRLLPGGVRPALIEAGQRLLEAIQAQKEIAAGDTDRVAVRIEFQGLLAGLGCRPQRPSRCRHSASFEYA
jgi:hypothetical protein